MKDIDWGHFQVHVIQRYLSQQSLDRVLAGERQCLEDGRFLSLMSLSCVF